jgi:hypothetical protein
LKHNPQTITAQNLALQIDNAPKMTGSTNTPVIINLVIRVGAGLDVNAIGTEAKNRMSNSSSNVKSCGTSHYPFSLNRWPQNLHL